MIKVKNISRDLEDMLALFDDKYDKKDKDSLNNLVAPAAQKLPFSIRS